MRGRTPARSVRSHRLKQVKSGLVMGLVVLSLLCGVGLMGGSVWLLVQLSAAPAQAAAGEAAPEAAPSPADPPQVPAAD